MNIFIALLLFAFPCYAWQLGPFERVPEGNPLIIPDMNSSFFCPVQNRPIAWESDHTFNPAAVVREGKVYLFYRAEDHYGEGIGKHTSRIGLAISDDGIHFKRLPHPILYPDKDTRYKFEWPGGCEDPRIVEREDGTYVMTYTAWNQKNAALAVATSTDLLHWKKRGSVFHSHFQTRWSKSGSIVCRLENDRLIATKIQGKYWMFWGEGNIYVATSDDLLSWKPIVDEAGEPWALLKPRAGLFDSELVEPGPPALMTNEGILLLYNGKNSAGSYSAGQLLLNSEDPTQIVHRSEDCFLKPEKSFETKGQYQAGTVFIEGLIRFQGKWFLYYGGADSTVGVAVTN